MDEAQTQTETQTATKLYTAADDGGLSDLFKTGGEPYSELYQMEEGAPVSLTYDSRYSDDPVTVEGEILSLNVHGLTVAIDEETSRILTPSGHVMSEKEVQCGRFHKHDPTNVIKLARPDAVTEMLEDAVDDDEDDDDEDEGGDDEGDDVVLTYENAVHGADETGAEYTSVNTVTVRGTVVDETDGVVTVRGTEERRQATESTFIVRSNGVVYATAGDGSRSYEVGSDCSLERGETDEETETEAEATLVTDGGTDADADADEGADEEAAAAAGRFSYDGSEQTIREGHVVAYRPVKKHRMTSRANYTVGVVSDVEYAEDGTLTIGSMHKHPPEHFDAIYFVRSSLPDSFNPRQTPSLSALDVSRAPDDGRITGIVAEIHVYGPTQMSNPTTLVVTYQRRGSELEIASVRQKGVLDAGEITNPTAVTLATDILASELTRRVPDLGANDIPTFTGDVSPAGEEWTAFLDRLREIRQQENIYFESGTGV